MQFKRKNQADHGWFYGIFSQVFWGTGGAVTKLIDAALPSSLLLGMRHGIGALVLGCSIFTRKRHVLKNMPLFHLIMLGILAAGLPDLLFIEAIRRSGAIIAVMLARLEIPFGVLFAHWLLKEKVGLSAYIASLLALIGVVLMSLRPGQAITIHDQFYVGVLLGILVAVLWALAGIYAKYILNRKTDPLALSFVRLIVGSIFGLAVAIVTVRHPIEALQGLELADWGLILYLGIFLSGLAFLAYYKSLNILDAHVVAIMMGLSIAIVLLSGLVIGERMSILQWLGIALIVTSVQLIRRKPKPIEEPLDAD